MTIFYFLNILLILKVVLWISCFKPFPNERNLIKYDTGDLQNTFN